MPKRKSNGEGSIYQRPDGKWCGQITIGRDEKGKLRRKTVYGKTKKEVLEKLNQIRYGIMTGTFVDKSNITFYQLAKQMIDDKTNLNYVKETSGYRDMETLKRMECFYNTPLQRINETMLRDFLLQEQCYSQSLIDKEYQMMKRTFLEAVARGILSQNPLERVKKPKSKKALRKIRALTVDEQRKLMEILMTEDIPYSRQMLLSVLTGMRMGEINALQVQDIYLDFRRITVERTISRGAKGEAILAAQPKTMAGTRKIPITDDVCEILTDVLQFVEDGLLFRHNGKLITTSQVNLQFQRVLKKYGILDPDIAGDVTLHSLRHTYATRCIEAGMQPKVLQMLLGHTDITITMNTYCDAFEAFQSDNLSKATDYLKNMGLTLGNAAGVTTETKAKIS